MSEEQKIILFLLLVVCITIHEWAHAWVADRLGDPLPRQQGRVTLDPRSHVDPIGTLLIPLIMIFASPALQLLAGKPVQISLPNPETKKGDDILITIAGPLSNLSIAFICSLSFGLFYRFVPLGESALHLLYQIVSLNAVLFLFNLLPIPPLDGSHILKNMVNMKR